MNTTARIESTSHSGRIHLSSETAELLIRDGKGQWVEKREDVISAKGKGSLRTYWLKSVAGKVGTSFSRHSEDGATMDDSDLESESECGVTLFNEKTSRLIDWYTETLVNLLKQIVARRSVTRLASPNEQHNL